MYIDGGNGFIVEENWFTTEESSNSKARGLIVNQTGANDNEIYKNYFNNLLAGAQAQFVNKGSGNTAGLGLTFICNQHDNRYFDFWVGDKFEYSGMSDIGIAEHQVYNDGSFYLPGGNIFTGGYRFGDLDFSNKQAEHLIYHYLFGASSKQYPTAKSNVTPWKENAENFCPVKSSGGGTTIGQLYANRTAAEALLNSSTLILDIWKNGGNTELEEEVETTLPWEAYIEFNDLLTESPYLSDEVLIAAIENPVFSSLMIKLLIMANPQARHSDEVLNHLYDRIPPLPQSYIEEILAEDDTVSQLELLEGYVAADRHLYNNLGEQIKRMYRSDTTNSWAADSLLDFMRRDQQLNSRYELIATLQDFGYFEEASEALNDLESQFELSESEYDAYQSYLLLTAIREDMLNVSDTVSFLDANDSSNMFSILESNRPLLSSAAAAMLKRNNPDFEYDEIILEPDTSYEPKKSRNIIADKEETNLSLYPNPATDNLVVSYKVKDLVSNLLSLQIFDAAGRIVYNIELSSMTQEITIDLHSYVTGNYFLQLTLNKKVVAAKKFTVVH